MYSGVATFRDPTLYEVAFSSVWPDIIDAADQGDWYALYDAGTLPVIQPMFKYETVGQDNIVQAIVRGDYDTEIWIWCRMVKDYLDTGRECIVLPLPELNGPWVVYGPDIHNFDVSASVDVFRRFVTIGRGVGLTKENGCLWAWGPNDVGWGRLAPYFPGDEYFDIIAGSAYNHAGLGYEWQEEWETIGETVDAYVRDVRKLSQKPILITQTGSAKGDARTPGWLDDLVTYTLTDKIEGFIWFDIAEYEYMPGPADFNQAVMLLDSTPPLHWFEPETEEPMEDQGRNQLYVKQGMSGQDVEYWQVMCIMAIKNIPYYGNSNSTFIKNEAPQLTFKQWDQIMTDYLSAWTGRNSYGIGATERIMIEEAVYVN